jgi:hypothetical protein
MVLEKLYDEVSSFLEEEKIENVYKNATNEPHNYLYTDTQIHILKQSRINDLEEILI